MAKVQGNVAQGNPNARTTDPPFAGAFRLEIDGVALGAFTEVTGLSVQMEIEEIAEGGNNVSTIKVPGRLKWPNLVLKRGITDNNSLFEWLAKCSGDGYEKEAFKITKPSGTLFMLDSKQVMVRSWKFREAMPVRWTGPTFAASASALALEELEVSHGGFTS
jgi:phage tail-like protein